MTYRDVLVSPPQLGATGHFELRVGRRGQPPRQIIEFDNLITDQGLDQMNTGFSAAYCRIGTGTTPPSNSSTGLSGSGVSTSGNHSNGTGSGNVLEADRAYSWITVGKRFNEGALNGNYSEIGMFTGNNNTSAVALSLILDGAGNPTSITVLPDEILDVLYTRRLYVLRGDWTGSVTVGANVHAFTARWSSLPSMGNLVVGISGSRISGTYRIVSNFGDDVSGISGTSAGWGSAMAAGSYTPGTFAVTSTVTSGVGVVNTGILALQVSSSSSGGSSGAGPAAKYLFDPIIPVASNERIALTWQHSWGRYTP